MYDNICPSGINPGVLGHVRGYWGTEGPYREFITLLTVLNETIGLCMDFFDAFILAVSEFTTVVGRDPAVLGAHLIRHRRLTRCSSTSPPSALSSSCPRTQWSSASRVAPVLLVAYVRFKYYVFGFFGVLHKDRPGCGTASASASGNDQSMGTWQPKKKTNVHTYAYIFMYMYM